MEQRCRLGLCRNNVGKVGMTQRASSNLKVLELCRTRSSLLFVVGAEKPKVISSALPDDFPQRELKGWNSGGIFCPLYLTSDPFLSFGPGTLSLKIDDFCFCFFPKAHIVMNNFSEVSINSGG